ncbi:MAG: DUF4199 domain-containing protein [Flavobacteriaceae bacterium]
MKNTVLRYGIYGGVAICGLFLLSWFIGGELDYTTQEVIGYASMIVSLSFVYFGVRHFRDKENSGTINFKKALLVGVLISLITALAFGILDVIYVKFINPDFMTEYYDTLIAELRETLPPAEFEIERQKMESQREMFSNTFMSFLVMFLTVFVIGFIISLISALLLQRKN